MLLIIAIIAQLGSPNYPTRQRTADAIEASLPASLPVVLVGLRSDDAEIRVRCERLAAICRQRLFEWTMFTLIYADFANGVWLPDNTQWLELMHDDDRRGVESFAKRRLGYDVVIWDSDCGHASVTGAVNVLRHFVRGRDLDPWRRCDMRAR